MLCQGNACEQVTVIWSRTEGVYLVANRSERTVLVRFVSLGTVTELVLSAEAAGRVRASSFDVPYYAQFLE